jgi:hypothetical protein
MKKYLGLLIILFLSFMLFIPSQANAVIISDNYYGADDHGHGDVIGREAVFGADWMDVYIIGDNLYVDIKTNYQGNDYDGFSSLDTDFGDFFISTDGWDPWGSNPYLNDNSTNGEDWEYAFDVQTGNLYDISSSSAQSHILLSQHVMPSSGWIFRNGQEVAIDTSGLSAFSTGTAGYLDGGFYKFVINIADLDWQLGDLGFHWAAATCGNDVIEGSASVPEPTAMMLLGSGMILLAGFGRRKFVKKK